MSNIPFISAPTTAQLIASVGASYQEQAWEKVVVRNAGVRHPLASMKIGTQDLNKRLPNAAIVTTTTLSKGIYGQTINQQVRAPIGGFGVQGAGGYRLGKGVKVKDKMWSLSTGVHWNGIVWNNISRAQTLVGRGDKDLETQNFLKEFYGWLTGNFLEAEIIRATAAAASRTVFYANNKTTLNSLTSNDTLSLADITRLENALSENGAAPFSLTTDGNYNDIQEFLIMAPHYAWDALSATDEWMNLLQTADVRGDKNRLFQGGMPKWKGSRLFNWRIQTSVADGPVGAFAAPYAYLGEAVAAGSAAFSLKGGGNSEQNKALLNAPYFINFAGSRFKAFETQKLAQETNARKYLLAYNASNDTWAFGSYTTIPNGDIDDATGTYTDANTISIDQFLSATNASAAKTTLGSVTWDTGVWNGKHCEWSDLPVGSKVWQCNSKGQPYNLVYGLGRHAILDGYGRISGDGSVGMAQRTEEIQNHGVFAEIGMAMSYGAQAQPNADGIPPLVLMYCAINPPGLPVIQ